MTAKDKRRAQNKPQRKNSVNNTIVVNGANRVPQHLLQSEHAEKIRDLINQHEVVIISRNDLLLAGEYGSITELVEDLRDYAHIPVIAYKFTRTENGGAGQETGVYFSLRRRNPMEGRRRHN